MESPPSGIGEPYAFFARADNAGCDISEMTMIAFARLARAGRFSIE